MAFIMDSCPLCTGLVTQQVARTENRTSFLEALAAQPELFFPKGLIGFEDCRRFSLELLEDVPWILNMQCLDAPGVSFYISDPSIWRPDCRFEVPEHDRQTLGADDGQGLQAVVILNVEVGARSITANLLGPLIINPHTMRGLQVIQSNSNYSTREPILGPSRRIFFPNGLIGLPTWRNFTIRRLEAAPPLRTLDSQEDASLSFLIVDPIWVDPSYQPQISDAAKSTLEINDAEEIEWYCILSIASDGKVTANLLAPLAIARRSGRACQVIQTGSCYTVDHPLA